MDDTKMQAIADAAVAYLLPRLLVKASYVPVAPRHAVSVPKYDVCPHCGVPESAGFVVLAADSLEQPAASLVLTECKGMLDSIAGQLNMAGAPILTHEMALPSGILGKAQSEKGGLALRGAANFDIVNNRYVLRFDVLYSKSNG